MRIVNFDIMRLEWPVYVFTACVFLAFALGVQFLNLGTGAVVGLFLLLTVAYAWVAWVMIKQKGRARTSRLCSVQQLWRIDAFTGQPLHELRHDSQHGECKRPKLNVQGHAEFRL